MFHQASLRAPRLLALGAGLLAALGPVVAAGTTDQGTPARRSFEWRQSQDDLGDVEVPPDIGPGWQGLAPGTRYRRVPSYSTDPTFEILFGPGASGADRPERVLVQVPGDFLQRPLNERAVVVGFHSYSRSEKQVFMETDLPDLCAERGWLLLAPYGLVDTSFGRPETQASLETVLEFLHGVLPYDRGRIYGVGFSMGAHSALSYAMRHHDPDGYRFAGVVFHTGRLDMVRNFELGTSELRELMMDEDHFGGSPAEVLFEYERVSPARLLPTGEIYWSRAPVTNVLHVPVYIHANLADPDPTLVSEAMELRNYLALRGGNVHENFVLEPLLGHSWQTLELGPALDQVSVGRLDDGQRGAEVFADRDASYHHVRVLDRTPDFHGHFHLDWDAEGLGTVNGFAIRHMRDVRGLAIDVESAGLDVDLPLAFEVSSRDGAELEIVLEGYPTAPSTVLSPFGLRWSHDATSRELSIRVRTDGSPLVIDVLPGS